MKISSILILILILLSAYEETSDEIAKSSETTTSITTETPIILESSPMESLQAWQEVYAEFLRENIPVCEVDFDAFVDGSDEGACFGAFMAGGYPVTPFFYLYDLDNDGTPEMIYIDVANGVNGEVYTYKNDSISKVGSIGFYPFGGLGVPLDKTEGLYSDVGYKRHYGKIYFYFIDTGVLTEQMVLEYNNGPEISSEHPGLPYSFDNFAPLAYYEVSEENIINVIYGTE